MLCYIFLIPELMKSQNFEMAFGFLNKSDHVTSKYHEFKTDTTGKSILVCNFRTFRGLENPAVTIVVDRDIYSLQHYLVEAMARCTSKLAVVVLERSPSLSEIIKKWLDGENGKQLIDHWKIKVEMERKKELIYNNSSSDQVSKVIVYPFSKEHKQMEQQFNSEKEKQEYNKFRARKEAEETILKR